MTSYKDAETIINDYYNDTSYEDLSVYDTGYNEWSEDDQENLDIILPRYAE